MAELTPAICNNCGADMADKYCPHCGQKRNSGRLTFHELWHDVMYYIFSLDAPFIKTFRGILLKPGETIREYIFGKRKAYYSPVKYFILAIAIYFLMAALLDFDPVKIEFKARGLQAPDQVLSSKMLKTTQLLQNNINKFLFLLVFIFAAGAKLMYKKHKFKYTEYIALSFFTCAQYLFINSLVIPLTYISVKFVFLRYVTLLFFIAVLMDFHKEKLFPNLIKSVSALILSYVIYIVICMFIAYAVVLYMIK